MIQRRILPVRGLAPDQHDYADLHLEQCSNLVPVHGEMVPLHFYDSIAKITDSEEINSGYCHIVTSDLNVQTARAKSTHTSSGWYQGEELSGNDLHLEIDEVTPDDESLIKNVNSAQNPTLTPCKIELDDIEDPTVLTNHKLTVRVRAQYNPHTFTKATSNFIANIYHFDGASTWTKVGAVDLIDETDLENNIWYTFTGTLDSTAIDPPLSAASDYDQLYMYFEGDMVNTAAPDPWVANPISVADNEDGWTDKFSGAGVVISNIEEGTEEGTDPNWKYMVSPILAENESASIDLDVDSIPVYMSNMNSLKMGYFAITDSSGDMKIKAELVDTETNEVFWEEEEVVDEDDWGTPLETEHVATTGADSEVELYNTHKDNCVLRVTATSTAASSATVYRPTGDNYNAWETGNPSFYQRINDDPTDDDTYIEGSSGRIEPTWNNLSEPSSWDGVKVRLRLYRVSGSTGSLKITITDASDGIVTKRISNITDSSWKNYYMNLDSSDAQSLNWDDTWEVDIKIEGTGTYRLSEAAILSESTGATLSVGEAYVIREVDPNYAVSWAKFNVPDVDNNVKGDTMRIYGGSVDKLLEVKDIQAGEIADVTRSSAAYGLTNQAQAWDFCSWGGNVIAVNYEDDMQWMDIENGGTLFEKLEHVDSSVSDVKAKFCAVVQNNLVVANINHNDYTSYHVGWSHIYDPQKFSNPSYTYLSDFEPLRQTPGEITGLIGGDFGVIPKRNSIYRMSYVGPPVMYRFDVIARGIGTAYPQSIVVANDTIYFWGDNAFYAIKQGQPPIPISDGKVSRMLTDHVLDGATFNNVIANQRAFYPHVYYTNREYDNTLSGAYDKTTGLITWVYTCPDDTAGAHYKTKAVVFSIKTGEWGMIDFADYADPYARIPAGHAGLHVSMPIGLANKPELSSLPASEPMPGIVYWSREYDSGSRVELWQGSNVTTRPVSLLTSVLLSPMLGADPGARFSIHSIRPIWSNVNQDADIVRDVEMTLYVSENVEFTEYNNTSATLSSNADSDGWFHFRPISGSAIKIGISIDETYQNASTLGGDTYGMVPGLIALQFEFRVDGPD